MTVHRLSGTTGWHWHDLRRTCATRMARLASLRTWPSAILNHSGGSTMSVIARTYNRYSYEAEMRRALECGLGELAQIVAGEPAKVVALRSAG